MEEGQMATCDPTPRKYEDVEATGRKVYGVYGFTKTGPKLMWKNISRLLEAGVISVCLLEHELSFLI